MGVVSYVGLAVHRTKSRTVGPTRRIDMCTFCSFDGLRVLFFFVLGLAIDIRHVVQGKYKGGSENMESRLSYVISLKSGICLINIASHPAAIRNLS